MVSLSGGVGGVIRDLVPMPTRQLPFFILWGGPKDNFEGVVDGESRNLHDQELEEALRALLELPAHGVKVIVTTRIAPRALLARASALARARRGTALAVRGKRPACAGPGRQARPAGCTGRAARHCP